MSTTKLGWKLQVKDGQVTVPPTSERKASVLKPQSIEAQADLLRPPVASPAPAQHALSLKFEVLRKELDDKIGAMKFEQTFVELWQALAKDPDCVSVLTETELALFFRAMQSRRVVDTSRTDDVVMVKPLDAKSASVMDLLGGLQPQDNSSLFKGLF